MLKKVTLKVRKYIRLRMTVFCSIGYDLGDLSYGISYINPTNVASKTYLSSINQKIIENYVCKRILIIPSLYKKILQILAIKSISKPIRLS